MNLNKRHFKQPHRKWQLLCIYLLSMLPITGMSQTDFYGFSKIPLSTTFNTNDYNGGIQNWSITQNDKGYIYVANNFGLLEYDGNSWRKYEIENNTRLRSVFIDNDQRIYIGGQNQFGYFEPDASGRLIFHSLVHQLDKNHPPLEDVWKIIKKEDQVLFCSFQGIIAYDGQQLRSLPNSESYEMTFQVASRLFCQSTDQGLLEWNGQNFTSFSDLKIFKENPIAAILAFKNNSLLIFLKNGRIFSQKQEKLTEWTVDVSPFLSKSGINTAIILQNNSMAIGTQNNGVVIVSPEGKVIKHLTKGKGLNNRTVLSLYEDQFYNLWVGLNNGINLVELTSPFSVIDEQSGLPGTGYSAAFHEETLYLGTSNGLFYQKTKPDPIDELNSQYHLVENTNGQVYNVQVVDNEVLLAHHEGAFQIKNGKAYPFFSETGTWKFAKVPNEPYILAGTYDGFRLFEKSDVGYRLKNTFPEFTESSRVFEFYDHNTLFMTHGYKGVYRIQFDENFSSITQVDFFGQENGFPSNILINVFKVDNQLVFAAEQGLFGFQSITDDFFHIQKLETQLGADRHIREITQDLSGNIYYLSSSELGYLSPTAYGGYEKQESTFSRVANLLSDDLENITVIDHENVILGAEEGFLHFNPSINPARNQPFKTYIRRVESTMDQVATIYDGSGEDLTSRDFAFPAFFPSLKIQYASPYFYGQNKLQFQFMLEKFDKDWSEWSLFTEKEYTNLAEGTYNFRVRAKNVYGDVSEEASFKFRVYPPWYRSQLAYLLYALGVFIVFGMVVFLLDKRYKVEKARLALNQKRELIRKDNEIVEVSKKSSAEIDKLKNDKLRSEIDYKNRELATTTMHLIQKNEFMLKVRDNINDIAKSNSKEAIRKLIKDIDKNLSEDEGWEQFTKHFDQVHGAFLQNLKQQNPSLTPQEIKLCAYLRMNMSSKEIANLLNISVRGVEISRYRLRKKLDIDRSTNLIDYMMEYS